MEDWTTLKPLVITRKEYNAFHLVDRKLYATLVHELWHDPVEAIQMMAVWLWLERNGFSSLLTGRILTLPFQLINEFGDEALLLWVTLRDMEILPPSYVLEIPLTQMFLRKEMSFQYLYVNRESTTAGINKVIVRVCSNCLKDIMDEAIQRNARVVFLQSISQMGLGPEPEIPMSQRAEIRPEDRTMFVTFSKGYPVGEKEVREYFTKLFGECIQSFHMQEVVTDDQALFARVVFYHPSYINNILDGENKAKFTINGKHVWMRKFIPKRTRGLPFRGLP